MGEEKSRQETIQAIPPDTEYEIVRVIGSDGEITYQHPIGGHIHTYSDGLYNILSLSLARLETMVRNLDDDAHANFGFIAEAVIRDARSQLHEICRIIENTIGEIEFDVVGHNDLEYIYRRGRILDATLTPPGEVQNG